MCMSSRKLVNDLSVVSFGGEATVECGDVLWSDDNWSSIAWAAAECKHSFPHWSNGCFYGPATATHGRDNSAARAADLRTLFAN